MWFDFKSKVMWDYTDGGKKSLINMSKTLENYEVIQSHEEMYMFFKNKSAVTQLPT